MWTSSPPSGLVHAPKTSTRARLTLTCSIMWNAPRRYNHSLASSLLLVLRVLQLSCRENVSLLSLFSLFFPSVSFVSLFFPPSAAAKLLELQGQCQRGVCVNLLLCVRLLLMTGLSSASACLSDSITVSAAHVCVSLGRVCWAGRQNSQCQKTDVSPAAADHNQSHDSFSLFCRALKIVT